MRKPARRALKGSQYWLQTLVNDCPDLLAERLGRPVEWLSPLAADDYAEYRDADFLVRLGLEQHAAALRTFWPLRGPRWDGLGRSGSTVYLVEAKANVSELRSTCAAISPQSRELIAARLRETRRALGADPAADWLAGYYQLANRLAHVTFMRETLGLDAVLVLLCIVGDRTHIPTSRAVWDAGLAAEKAALGLGGGALRGRAVELFIDAAEIEARAGAY